jgi:hypothetical protein
MSNFTHFCDFCTYKTTRKYNLIRHQNTKHLNKNQTLTNGEIVTDFKENLIAVKKTVTDIKENLTEISKDDIISFKLDPEEVKLLQGSYENVRRIISLPEVEKNKYTNVFKRNFDTSVFKKFKHVKLHIDRDYFYFTGHHENKDGTKPVEFQSLNFDVRFLESLENTYKSMVN